MSGMHKRKTSREEDDHGFSAPNGVEHPRPRTISTPAGLSISVSPPSAMHAAPPGQLPSPNRSSTLPAPRANGHAPTHRAPSSPMRQSFSMPAHMSDGAHGRTRSVSGFAHSPSSPSPLSTSFPSNPTNLFPSSSTGEINRHARNNSRSFAFPPPGAAPLAADRAAPLPPMPPPTSANARRHARLHSRNLSVFFPRPGQAPQPTIDEDGAQDVVYKPTPETLISPASPRPGKLGEGFTFGGRPPQANGDDGGPATGGPQKARRGHHHKHSMSHNFFSFLEPGADGRLAPNSTADKNGERLSVASIPPTPVSATGASAGRSSPFGFAADAGRLPPAALAACAGQFVLGAWLWIAGQAAGSLACTGLGYWVVFDSLGVALAALLPAYLQRPAMQSPLGRAYGNARVETLALFGAGVYLMFSAVYVFKETVEHVLLSAGEGHHHHPGDEDVEISGIDFPIVLLLVTFLSLIGNAVAFDNHHQLVNITGNRLPPLSKLLDPSRFKYSSYRPEPTTALARMAENPYSLAPTFLALLIPLVSILVPASEHRALDLLLAAAETLAMFMLAYPACTATGTVLLQTAPARGGPHGRTEAFLRAMRELERHPQVQSLPPPHVWTLAAGGAGAGSTAALVVALELRVARELDDPAVLRLTRWAHARCAQALGLGGREAEEYVTVGVVRG